LFTLNITRALNREPDPFRLQKLEGAIDESLQATKGNPQLAFLHLIGLAEREFELNDLIADVMTVALARHVYRTCDYLNHN